VGVKRRRGLPHPNPWRKGSLAPVWFTSALNFLSRDSWANTWLWWSEATPQRAAFLGARTQAVRNASNSRYAARKETVLARIREQLVPAGFQGWERRLAHKTAAPD